MGASFVHCYNKAGGTPMMPITRREFIAATGSAALLARPPQDAPPLRLGMIGMWHSHAEGIVRRVSENPKEFTLVGFCDSDAEVVARRKKTWEALIPGYRV